MYPEGNDERKNKVAIDAEHGGNGASLGIGPGPGGGRFQSKRGGMIQDGVLPASAANRTYM